jgi:hypothetical protein
MRATHLGFDGVSSHVVKGPSLFEGNASIVVKDGMRIFHARFVPDRLLSDQLVIS